MSSAGLLQPRVAPVALALAALAGFLCVGFGAFAAHGTHDPKAQEWLRLGAEYGFVHVLATLACPALVAAGAGRARFAPPLFLTGVLFFCGSLWAMALGAPLWFGAITPIGGLLFLAGWLWLAWSALGIGAQAG